MSHPITDQFAEDLKRVTLSPRQQMLAKYMLTYLGEYAHGGAAKPSELFGDADISDEDGLRLMKIIFTDFLLTFDDFDI